MAGPRRPLNAAAAAWAALFGAAHLYWALGGRLGVPAGTEPIAERPWFLVYDLVAGGLCLVAAVMLRLLARAHAPPRAVDRPLIVALRVAAAVLALRATVGLAGDAALIAGGELRATMLFDAWFALGAVLFALALRERRRRQVRAGDQLAT